MKELIEYLERKIELCTEMNMPLEKFAYTDALKKARALQLQQTGVVGRSEQLQGFIEFYKQKFGCGFNTDVLEITLKQYQETL